MILKIFEKQRWWPLIFLILIGALIVFGVVKNNLQINSGREIKTPHFLDSTPLARETYAASPINVTLNFDFDLSEKSSVSVTSENKQEWTEGPVLIEDNQTALKRKLKTRMPDGNYLVKYSACWPDNSCHKGQFSFKIDDSLKGQYQDLRANTEVTMKMKEVKFDQNRIIISPGTKVTWVNEDDFGHFVNTETHPEHTYFPAQNSREIKKGETFAVIFDEIGQYNYHCSAHVPEGMIASIIVTN